MNSLADVSRMECTAYFTVLKRSTQHTHCSGTAYISLILLFQPQVARNCQYAPFLQPVVSLARVSHLQLEYPVLKVKHAKHIISAAGVADCSCHRCLFLEVFNVFNFKASKT